MIQLTTHDGRTVLLHRDAIAQVQETGPSSQWHGIRSIIKTFDGRTLEMRETVYQVGEAIQKELSA